MALTNDPYSLATHRSVFAVLDSSLGRTRVDILSVMTSVSKEDYLLYLLEQDPLDKEYVIVVYRHIQPISENAHFVKHIGIFMSCLFHDDVGALESLNTNPSTGRGVLRLVLESDIAEIVDKCADVVYSDLTIATVLLSLLIRDRAVLDRVLTELSTRMTFQELFNKICVCPGHYYTKWYLELERLIIRVYNWDLRDNDVGFEDNVRRRLRFLLETTDQV